MSHSKGTTNYNLPLFTKDDRPAWLTDFNSAMLEVDTVVKGLSDKVKAGGLPMSGGTMTGPLTLSGAPTGDLQAATKKYVDDQIATNITAAINASY